MKRIFLLMCSLLLVFGMFGSASATTILDSSTLAGYVSITGFADGTATTFTSTLSNLSGSGVVQTLPDGMYDVFAQGSASFLGYGDAVSGNPGYVTLDITNPQLIYSGWLGSTGLTQGSYPFLFGTNLGSIVNFDFTINYDGNAGPLVMAGLAGFGFPFVDPAGAGSLHVSGSTNGLTATVNFEETNLTWTGFGGVLYMADQAGGGGNGIIDGNFTLNLDITGNPVPEPATMLLFGLGLLGLAGVNRKK